jgi:hypothetical protein
MKHDEEGGDEEHRHESYYPQNNLCGQRMSRLFFCQPLHRVQRYDILFKTQKNNGIFCNDGGIWKNMCTFVPSKIKEQSNENTDNHSYDADDRGFCGNGTGGDEDGLMAQRGDVCQQ